MFGGKKFPSLMFRVVQFLKKQKQKQKGVVYNPLLSLKLINFSHICIWEREMLHPQHFHNKSYVAICY